MSSLYREELLDHYKNPRHRALLNEFTHKGEGRNLSCGDRVELTLRVDEEGVMEEVGWDGTGCAVMTASASKLSEWLVGRRLDDVLSMSGDELRNVVGFEVTPARENCLMLLIDTLKEVM